MFIDPLNEAWVKRLMERQTAIPPDMNLYLLIDGAFLPGLFRSREFSAINESGPRLLFEALPSCSEAVRDASPFLVPLNKITPALIKKLDECSGWPMLSAIETTEGIDELASRLSAWCVIENDGQRFNFRFPDTRRLPRIFELLTPQQRAEFCGPMGAWSFIARDGNWQDLAVAGTAYAVASNPSLDDAQFGAMVRDSEADEMLSRLKYSGVVSAAPLSTQHRIVYAALKAAAGSDLPEAFHMQWCEFTLQQQIEDVGPTRLAKWRQLEVNTAMGI